MSTNYIDQITDTGGTTHDITEGDSTRIFRATCSTAASTAAKVATLDTSNRNFTFTAGVRVAVTFTYGNTANAPTLRVDGESTGTAKSIATAVDATSVTIGSGNSINAWGPYETIIFTYDGTFWVKGASGVSASKGYAQVTLNGSANRQPSFYAPTSAGTSGHILYSNGSGAPTWGAAPGGVDTTYPVGSICVMSTNTNPNTVFTGTTWELVDKEFKHQFINSGVVTKNSTNVTSIDNQVFELEGHHIWCRVWITNKVVLNDDAKPLFTIDVDKIGINSSYSDFIYGWTDQGNGIVLASLPNSESGSDITVESRDVVTRGSSTTYVAASSTIYFSFEIHTGTSGLIDSFCDKFYWKRTA